MKDGLIQQVADPTTIYENPANLFVAGFIGTPPMNFFEGTVRRRDDKFVFDDGTWQFELVREHQAAAAKYADKRVAFGIRPEHVGSPTAEATPGAPTIKAKVEVIEPMGAETYLYVNTGRNAFTARIDPHRRCRVGEEVQLAMLPSKAHLFDLQSTLAIL